MRRLSELRVCAVEKKPLIGSALKSLIIYYNGLR